MYKRVQTTINNHKPLFKHAINVQTDYPSIKLFDTSRKRTKEIIKKNKNKKTRKVLF